MWVESGKTARGSYLQSRKGHSTENRCVGSEGFGGWVGWETGACTHTADAVCEMDAGWEQTAWPRGLDLMPWGGLNGEEVQRGVDTCVPQTHFVNSRNEHSVGKQLHSDKKFTR